MPNWCSNTIIVRGTKKQREDFKAKYCEEIEYYAGKCLCIDFNKIIPEPQTIEECPEEYVLHNAEEAKQSAVEYEEANERKWFNWHKWHCDKWGVKWNADANGSEDRKTSFTIWFGTPWGPPIEVLSRLIKENPQLKISGRFDEPNMDLHVKFSYKDWKY